MIKGFKMKLYEGQAAEYEKRHNQLWPEMKEMIHQYGGKNYSIFGIRIPTYSLAISRSRTRPYGPSRQTPPSTGNGGISWRILWKPTRIIARYA